MSGETVAPSSCVDYHGPPRQLRLVASIEDNLHRRPDELEPRRTEHDFASRIARTRGERARFVRPFAPEIDRLRQQPNVRAVVFADPGEALQQGEPVDCVQSDQTVLLEGAAPRPVGTNRPVQIRGQIQPVRAQRHFVVRVPVDPEQERRSVRGPDVARGCRRRHAALGNR